MKVLLIYPRFPITYWGLQYTLPIVRKRAVLPPLGLITLAACLPQDWELHLVDLNIQSLPDSEILWADLVLVSGMQVQAPSIHEVLSQAARLKKRTLLGGPAATASPEDFPEADLIFVGEIEGRTDQIVSALARSEAVPAPTRILRDSSNQRPDLAQSPLPRFDLLDLDAYTSMSVQYSRGCPFSCEFCDVIQLFGKVPRVKRGEQILAELEAIYRRGYRGTLFFVDDNFIGNSREVRRLLPLVRSWQESRGFPYSFYTEASLNLAGDPQLMKSMVEAGFTTVFLGIETPSKAALASVGKKQNLKIELDQAVNIITGAGLEVMAGFIAGFDTDTPDIFDAQRDFIANSPIPHAMIGLLAALPNTELWHRLKSEGRLRGGTTGDPFGRPNFTPIMNEKVMLENYADLLASLYSPRAFFKRCHEHLRRTVPSSLRAQSRRDGLMIFANAILRLGVMGENRRHFWKLLIASLWKHRSNPSWGVTWAVGHSIEGEHMMRYTRQNVLPRIQQAIHETSQRDRIA